jgi:hypothetical protein
MAAKAGGTPFRTGEEKFGLLDISLADGFGVTRERFQTRGTPPSKRRKGGSSMVPSTYRDEVVIIM